MFHQITADDGTASQVWTDGDPERTEIAFRYITAAYPEEPLFCVRGRDRLAIPAATAYLGLTAGLPGIYPVENAVMRDIAAFYDWQNANPDLLKYPDR